MSRFNALKLAVLMSIALVSIGYLLGLPVWNDGWSLDLSDLGGIPLVLWVVYSMFKKNEG